MAVLLRAGAELRRKSRSAPRHGNKRWVEPLRRADVNRLWKELQRLVIHHPLVRASHGAGLLVEIPPPGQRDVHADVSVYDLTPVENQPRLKNFSLFEVVGRLGLPE